MDALTVIAENLSDAHRLLADGMKLRRAHLAELTAYLQGRLEAEEADSLTSLYSEFEEAAEAEGESGETNELAKVLSLLTRLELCRRLPPSGESESVPEVEMGQPTVAYFRNPYAGRVLRCVTDLLPDAEAADAEDYTDACEGVADGRYDFCVLPIESARDGVMNRFVQLIARYGLFTVFICHIELAEEEYIRFALLAASPCRLPGADRMELRAVPSGEQLWELLFALEALGAKLMGCRSMTGQGEEGYLLTLQVDKADPAALANYLGLGRSRSTLTGFYRELILPVEAETELLY